MLKNRYLLILLSFCSCLHHQTKESNSIIQGLDALYSHDFQKFDDITEQLNSPIIYDALIQRLKIEKEGFGDLESLNKYDEVPKDEYTDFLYQLTQADILESHNYDTLAFKYYENAEQIALELKNEVLLRETYYQLCHFVTGLKGAVAKDSLYNNYFKLYENQLTDKLNDYNYIFLDLFWALNSERTEEDIKRIDSYDEFIKNYNYSDPYYIGEYYQIKAIYVSKSYEEEDILSSIEYNQKAIPLFEQSEFKKAERNISSIHKNTGYDYMSLGKFKQSIPEFNKSLSYLGKDRHSTRKRGDIYLALSEVYQELGDNQKATDYLFKSNESEDSLKQLNLMADIYGAELKFNVEQKEKEVVQLSKTKNLFKWQVFALVPLALLLTLLAYRYYTQYVLANTEMAVIQTEFEEQVREKANLQTNLDQIQSKIIDLEQEREETIDRLQQLKEVVTKDFIVLQDKSKVYIEELMYIQSDDHYLRVHLHNKKENFVRGKISKIIEELPPNFIRCHRSYIVNQNYIKKILTTSLQLTDGSEVPVSKKYREFFN